MKLTINHNQIEIIDADLDKSLLHYFREDLDLTGTKNGCEIGVCGTCTVLVNHVPVKACKLKVRDIIEKEVLTIEGMADEQGNLHPLQQAFLDAGAIQCGFCTPGMVLTAHAFLLKNHTPTRAQARQAIRGNLCRCTGYQQIIDAILQAAEHYR